MKIDEKTSVPLVWLVALLASTTGMTAMGAFWVFSVNYRLSRIEKVMGIKNDESAGLAPMSSAYAVVSEEPVRPKASVPGPAVTWPPRPLTTWLPSQN